MSGHSKWATIKRKKAATDSARGKVFTRIIKEITIAARDGGGDPVGNPRLRLAIQNAKSSNMPQDNITRAVKKGTGELEGVMYTEITYEAYAPHGVAVIIQSVTDNRNRTIAELRHIVSKNNGNMGDAGSVSWMFERKGVVTIEKGTHTEDDVMEVILDLGADDLKTEEEHFEIICPIENLETVRKGMEEKGYKLESANMQYIPKELITLDEEKAASVIRFLETVEEYDDVQNLFTNADL
ncbi:MAG: YebC/PmpR family DNA-binding transcriptional regulator [Ignavibacteriae bacterium]|nr:YebC/PmpR family DNA-binding transcriptional regulator [Ignavibacteriota bacterium]